MKKKSTSQSAFFNLRVLIAAVFCLGALAVALFAQSNRSVGAQDAPGTQAPDVVRLTGPVIQTTIYEVSRTLLQIQRSKRSG
jgi:hypothetical protein